MLAALDIETQGLDATKFIAGCIIKEGSKKPEVYTSKKKLWQRVIELGISEAKRKKILNIYSHNAQFDTAGYIDLADPHLVFFSNKPFIWAYKITKQECKELGIEPNKDFRIFKNKEEYTKWKQINHYREIIEEVVERDKIRVTYYLESKEIIKFLDTLSLYRMSLKAVGEILGIPKMETPQELLEEQERKITPALIKKIVPYMVRDTEICLQSVIYLREKIKETGTSVKRLYTINQVAINYLINQLRQLPKEERAAIFWNEKKGEVRRTFRQEEIHGAYRGGRCEAFKVGKYEGVGYVDFNSLYPYSLATMDFPDLRTERKVWRPLAQMDMAKLLKRIGVSRCLITNNSNKLGLLPVRTNTGNYYPRAGAKFIGTYTHIELEEALKEGYTIEDIEWSVIYKKMKNPTAELMRGLYKQRKQGNKLDNYFFKMMMNASIGKMAQWRTGQEFVIDSVERADEYLARNYSIVRGIKTNYMYKKKDERGPTKSYYMPIIPTLVNARARILMYQYYKKVPLSKILYTDTDSIAYLGGPYNFPISEKLGEFKTEYENAEMMIWGRKTYRIGTDIKISGFKKSSITTEDFDKGRVEDLQQVTIGTTTDLTKVGTFRKEQRDLNNQMENYKEMLKVFEQEQLFIDMDIEDINYFLPKVV